MNDDYQHIFGGPWTEEKLDCLEAYLRAYNTALSKRSFRRVYIDAFSGTGARYSREKENEFSSVIPIAEFLNISDDQAKFFEGSALRAMRIKPEFHNIVLIEKDKQKVQNLVALRKKIHDCQQDFTVLASNVKIYNEDANEAIVKLCKEADWSGSRTGRQSRAVLFLDPFGCQVNWETLVAVAATGAIDMWYLFPSGLGVYRMITQERGSMPKGWEQKLDKCLGPNDWRSEFYREEAFNDLFGGNSIEHRKIATIDSVERFFIQCLKTLFPYVADACLPLKNGAGYKMFSLCFASANQGVGGKIAVNIASHLLKREVGGGDRRFYGRQQHRMD